MTLPLFVIHSHDAQMPQNMQVGEVYTLPPAVATHAIKSQRLEVGEQLQLSDGKGMRAVASVLETASGTVRIDEVEREDRPSVRLGLIQALAKAGRDEQAIEMATEIGVDVVMPWQAQRSIVQWKGNKAAKALNKWRDVLVGATEQSRRSYVPLLLDMHTTKQLTAWIGTTVSDGDIVLILHQDATDSWTEFEQIASNLPTGHTIWVVVGPEGGITDDEIEMFKAQGAHALVIGSHILRASSAGSVALTLLSRVLGRYA